MQLHLQPHVYASVSAEGAIFLDIKQDQYFGLDAIQTAALRGVICGWPGVCDTDERGCAASTNDKSVLARRLVTLGLLTGDDFAGKPYAPMQLDEVATTTAASNVPEFRAPKIRPAHVVKYFASAAAARAMLRWLPLMTVVHWIQGRRPASAATNADIDTAIELADVFLRLRPFGHTSRDRCLFDSLTLTLFLFTFGIYPAWVFGVRVNPFAAHSWVQYGAYSLNEDPSVVRSYLPILVV